MARHEGATRYAGLVATVLLIAVACTRAAPEGERAARAGTNVFLIVLDAASAAYLSPYGAPEDATPQIAQLARESVVFEHAYSQSATTIPSTASLLTGVRVTTHGMSPRSRAPVALPTLAELLAPHGYRAFGFIGNPNAGVPALGFHRGYDVYVEVYARPAVANNPESEGTGGMRIVFPEDLNAAVFEVAGELRASHTFVHAHYLQPHVPYDPPAAFYAAPAATSSAAAHDWPELLARFRAANKIGAATTETVDLLETRYRANMRYVDAGVGTLLDRLRRDDLYDESLIVLTADHGDAFFKHRRFGHNYTLYDDMVRIPLMLKFPASDGIAPRRLPHPTATIDVTATILDYLQVPTPEHFEGDSLWPLITGRRIALEHPEVVLATAWQDMHAIRVGALKYIARGGDQEELYDLTADPDEQQNLIASRPEAARVLRARLDAIVERPSTSPIPHGQAAPVDPELRGLLEALGYVDE